MEIRNSNLNDIPKIMTFYDLGTAIINSENQVSWPKFHEPMIENEINASKQWKLIIDEKISKK